MEVIYYDLFSSLGWKGEKRPALIDDSNYQVNISGYVTN